nr:MAG TPA: hypothetical protein [Caudoviricetes sp.]
MQQKRVSYNTLFNSLAKLSFYSFRKFRILLF